VRLPYRKPDFFCYPILKQELKAHGRQETDGGSREERAERYGRQENRTRYPGQSSRAGKLPVEQAPPAPEDKTPANGVDGKLYKAAPAGPGDQSSAPPDTKKQRRHHVRVLWDEAANTRQAPRLEKLVAVIPSREISLCAFLQAKSQWQALYKEHVETLLDNMDNMIFLGDREMSTIKESSESWLGKATIILFIYCRSTALSPDVFGVPS
jgi:hypothetical protein